MLRDEDEQCSVFTELFPQLSGWFCHVRREYQAFVRAADALYQPLKAIASQGDFAKAIAAQALSMKQALFEVRKDGRCDSVAAYYLHPAVIADAKATARLHQFVFAPK